MDNAFQTEPELSLCRSQWVFICFHVRIPKFAFSKKNSYKIMGCQIPGVWLTKNYYAVFWLDRLTWYLA